MDRVQLSRRYGATTGRHLTLTSKSPGEPGSHLIDLGRIKGCFDLGAIGDTAANYQKICNEAILEIR